MNTLSFLKHAKVWYNYATGGNQIRPILDFDTIESPSHFVRKNSEDCRPLLWRVLFKRRPVARKKPMDSSKWRLDPMIGRRKILVNPNLKCTIDIVIMSFGRKNIQSHGHFGLFWPRHFGWIAHEIDCQESPVVIIQPRSRHLAIQLEGLTKLLSYISRHRMYDVFTGYIYIYIHTHIYSLNSPVFLR